MSGKFDLRQGEPNSRRYALILVSNESQDARDVACGPYRGDACGVEWSYVIEIRRGPWGFPGSRYPPLFGSRKYHGRCKRARTSSHGSASGCFFTRENPILGGGTWYVITDGQRENTNESSLQI